MVDDLAKPATAAAEMVAHLGRLAYGEGFVCGLTTTQWTALRYFARANRFSRTVSAFAAYHATTRGTASQTVKSLVTRGYLTRTRSPSDGRSVRFDLTENGQVLCRTDPFDDLVRAIAELPRGLQNNLLAALERVTGRLACIRQTQTFGSCPLCTHLGACMYSEDGKVVYSCRVENEPIEVAELDEICINFEPGAGTNMKRALARGRT